MARDTMLKDYTHYAGLALDYYTLARISQHVPQLHDSFMATAVAYAELAKRLYKYRTKSTIK